MKYLTSSEIRQMWLDFFASKGHKVEPSASLIPNDDPTLLWTNAGVTPLKKYFDGRMVPQNPRITNAQKCIRTNDIENVGKTARHHTFFEMLGNFSIGDYFRNEAIAYACELLFSDRWFGFDKDKIYITYYSNDLATKKQWLSEGIDEDHLIPMATNFWEIGEGPCGPDTEMFYDRGAKYDSRGAELIAGDIENDRFIEIWNIVFSQYNAKENVARENYQELPSKNIDTGSGLERLCCVIQGVDTNYDTDLFKPIIEKISEIAKVEYQGQMAFKVIADHVRTVIFAVADGATLSNEGRGYVLRRVLRRASKYAKSLGLEKPFMAELVDVVIAIMKSYYPYLADQKDIIKTIITAEEEKFLATLSSGEKRLEQLCSEADGVICAKDAFTLYDTYGFPLELTVEYAKEKNLTVDVKGFKKLLEEQKIKARQARKDEGSMLGQNEDFLNFKEESVFNGYDTLLENAKVIQVFAGGVVLDKTPFYAFSGGQLCDKGTIGDIAVKDVYKLPNGQHLHELEQNPFKIGDVVLASVDENNRKLTMKNHSAAHLLQAALQEVVGKYVHQQGSQVGSVYCRFDFNSYESLSDEKILEIEDLVNQYIKEAHVVKTEVMPLEEAKKSGAMALFGEKYGEMVRVVDMDVSKEFCAGTHVANTFDIVGFAICSFESIGSGIYRITAATSENAMRHLKDIASNVVQSINALTSKAFTIINEALANNLNLEYHYEFSEPNCFGYRYILALRKELVVAQNALKDLEKTYNQRLSQKALSNLNRFDEDIVDDMLFVQVDTTDSNLLKDMATTLRNNKKLKVVFLAGVADNQVTFVCATSGYDAGKLVKEAAKICQGGGGGKADLAQAGGKDVSKVVQAIETVKRLCQ